MSAGKTEMYEMADMADMLLKIPKDEVEHHVSHVVEQRHEAPGNTNHIAHVAREYEERIDSEVNQISVKQRKHTLEVMHMTATLADQNVSNTETRINHDQLKKAVETLIMEARNDRSELTAMRQEIGNIAIAIQQLTAKSNYSNAPPIYNQQPRGRSQSRGRDRPRQSGDLCFYHAQHGDKAYKCTPPCSRSNEP